MFIFLNIGLNLLYYVALPALYKSYPDAIGKIYSPTVGVGYAFFINLFCTGLITFFFWKELTGIKYKFDWSLLKRMLKYAWPILVLGIAGILNQTFDKMFFPKIYKQADVQTQLGIYGAAVKIAMIMALITQAFRYAYEPFVFGKSKDKDNRETYAQAMRYFIIFTLLAFLAVMAWIDIFKYIIAPDYWSGLKVVPIVMIDKTIWGAWFSGIGCAVLILVNVLFVPQYGYMACAWGGVAGYGTAMVLSYLVGQKHYPISYPLRDITLYVVVSAILFAAMMLPIENMWLALAYRTFLLLLFVGFIYRKENLGPMLAKLPVIGRFFK